MVVHRSRQRLRLRFCSLPSATLCLRIACFKAMSSGMVSFRVKGGAAGAEAVAARMMEQLQTIHYAVSLGHHRSLIYLLSTEDLAEREGSSYALEGAQLEAYRELAGDGVFRFSVGLEDPKDLIADLARVL